MDGSVTPYWTRPGRESTWRSSAGQHVHPAARSLRPVVPAPSTAPGAAAAGTRRARAGRRSRCSSGGPRPGSRRTAIRKRRSTRRWSRRTPRGLRVCWVPAHFRRTTRGGCRGRGWLDRFPGRAHLDAHPDVAVTGGWIHAARGRAEDAEAWLAAAGRGTRGRRAIRARLAARSRCRAGLCPDGAEQPMATDADAAVKSLPGDSQWYPMAMVFQGASLAMLGQAEQADAVLAEAAAAADRRAQARLAHWPRGSARCWPSSARTMGQPPNTWPPLAASSVRAARRLPDQRPVSGSQRSRPASPRPLGRGARGHGRRRTIALLLDAMPWLSVETRLELGQAYVALRDADAARELTREAGRIVRRQGPFGILATQVPRVRREIDAVPGAGDVVDRA